MYTFGKKSLDRLNTCHPDLILIMNELIKEMDVSILCGERGEKEQNEAYKKGNSKLKYPQSKHNKSPSLAVDVAPYPIDWNNIERFNEMCDKIEEIANRLNIRVRMGRDFSFKDYPHVELI